MKRWAVRFCVLLLLGAIVNVAVAWGCSQLSPVTHDKRGGYGSDIAWLKRCGYEEFGFFRTRASHDNRTLDFDPVARAWHNWQLGTVDVFCAIGAEWCVFLDPEVASGVVRFRGTPPIAGVTVRTGWPCVSLEGGRVITPSIKWNVQQASARELYDLRDVMSAEASAKRRSTNAVDRPIPLDPIWPGFAINTVFYAALLAGGWMLFTFPFALRRRMRIKRGLCPKCAYDLRAAPADSNACPECGAPR